MADHHVLHLINSCDLKGDKEINIKYQRDLRKINDAHYVCLLRFRLHSDLQMIAYHHQSIHEVATDKVFEIRTKIERYFPMKQVTEQKEWFGLQRKFKNAIKILLEIQKIKK